MLEDITKSFFLKFQKINFATKFRVFVEIRIYSYIKCQTWRRKNFPQEFKVKTKYKVNNKIKFLVYRK